MAYCKQQDLREAYRSLDDLQMESGDIDAFIAKSDATIDMYLAVNYSVPFTAVPSTPPIIREISKDLALVNIFTRHYTQEKRNSSDWVTARKEDVFALLDRLANPDDTFTIVTSDGAIIEQRTDQQQILGGPVQNYKPIFDTRNPVNQRIDPNRIDDENAEDL